MRVLTPTSFKVGITIFFIVCGIAYGLFQARVLISGPHLSVTTPVNGSTITSPLIEVRGNAQNIAFITLNGEQIYTDTTGAFKEKLLAAPGPNLIQVAVKDTFNRSQIKTIELYYKEQPTVPSSGIFSEADATKDVAYQ